MSNLVYLALGSNIEPEDNFKAALKLLVAHGRLLAVSSVWETPPLGPTDQPNFLNAAALVETDLSAARFKQDVIRPIERELGRVRSGHKFGPRPIDIDIVLFNRQIFNLDDQPIPDPELFERPFVALPLAEIAPDYEHPETGQSLRQIAGRFTATEQEMRLRPTLSRALAQLVI